MKTIRKTQRVCSFSWRWVGFESVAGETGGLCCAVGVSCLLTAGSGLFIGLSSLPPDKPLASLDVKAGSRTMGMVVTPLIVIQHIREACYRKGCINFGRLDLKWPRF